MEENGHLRKSEGFYMHRRANDVPAGYYLESGQRIFNRKTALNKQMACDALRHCHRLAPERQTTHAWETNQKQDQKKQPMV